MNGGNGNEPRLFSGVPFADLPTYNAAIIFGDQ